MSVIMSISCVTLVLGFCVGLLVGTESVINDSLDVKGTYKGLFNNTFFIKRICFCLREDCNLNFLGVAILCFLILPFQVGAFLAAIFWTILFSCVFGFCWIFQKRK